MPNRPATLASRLSVLHRFTPRPEHLRRSRFVAWLGPRLHEPRLWQWKRRPVARGVALGAFFALLIPFGQIPCTVVAGFLLRANLVAGAATTFISNPLTFGPIYYTAYHLGAALLARPERTLAGLPDAGTDFASLKAWTVFVASLGPPLLLGVAVLAPLAALVGYAVASAAWRMRVRARWRARQRSQCATPHVAQPEVVRR
jgi:uncharacterized protein (DUF2062 family)